MSNRNWIYARYSRDKLTTIDGGGFQTRHESIIALLRLAYDRVKASHPELLPESMQELAIYSDDFPDPVRHPCPWRTPGIRILTICDTKENAHRCFPCFSFWHWKEVNIPDYDEVMQQLRDHAPPTIDKLFWIGNPLTHPRRMMLLEVAAQHPDLMDCRTISWNAPTAYVSLADHANYKMLVDVEGRGYSGRTKMLANAPSLLFIQDRKYWDWAGALLRPGEHYVPVANDFGDLVDKVQKAKENPEESQRMVQACQAFAATHLTREAAVQHIMRLVFGVDAKN